MFYRDANGIEHESYEAACHYYGADTPEMLAVEAAADREMEISLYGRGRPTYRAYPPNEGARMWNDGEFDAPAEEPRVYRIPGCTCSDMQLVRVGCECLPF